jgi:hypothetical protein
MIAAARGGHRGSARRSSRLDAMPSFRYTVRGFLVQHGVIPAPAEA